MTDARWLDWQPVDQVAPAASNAKLHDLPGIKTSVDALGYLEPVIVDERTGRLVAGHGRLATLQALQSRELGKKTRSRRRLPDGLRVDGDGRWLVPVIRGWASADDAQAQAAGIALNRYVERGGWDTASLVGTLQALEVDGLLELTGFTDLDLAALLTDLDKPATRPPTDPAPAEPAETSPGQVWTLGPHRLAVGDARDPLLLDALLAGARPSLLLTDPPYGLNVIDGAGLSLDGDADPATAIELLRTVLGHLEQRLAPGAGFYVFHPSGGATAELPFLTALNTPPYRYSQGLVWVKPSIQLGHADYHWGHETIAAGLLAPAADGPSGSGHSPTTPPPDSGPDVGQHIAYGRRAGRTRRRGGGCGWYGGNAQSTVLRYDRDPAVPGHPTPKPVPLLAQLITNSARPDQQVLDPFAGSGSLLAACHSTRRTALLCELEPTYADLIVARARSLGLPCHLERAP